MNADLKTVKHKELTSRVIKAFYAVYNTLGYGFLEKVYENALAIELSNLDLAVKQQYPIQVHYDGKTVGEHIADILVQDSLIVEVKAVKTLGPEHDAQLLNYLKATPIEVGLLLNFGPKAEFKRKAFNNARKNI
ncbi:MAG TPA: GxxExxY protein [Nitrospiraceae bacterium]|nr:GxxExxY protein [Nitrospiraceae bacterium]